MKNEFKVGQRVRRVRGRQNNMINGDVGIITIINSKSSITLQEWGGGHDGDNLEIIKEPEFMTVNPMTFSNMQFDTAMVRDTYNQHFQEVVNYYSSGLKPIKKPFMKTISNMMKKLLDADTQALVKAGYINGDLELTTEGGQALQMISFIANKAELVKMAQEKIIEEAKK